MKLKLKKFFYRHFVKTKYVQSVIILPVEKNGKKYLHIIKTGEDGKVKRTTYLVEHLVNENYEVTDQTLQEEKEWFITLS